jgi:hypothetical protein
VEDPTKWQFDRRIPVATIIGGLAFLISQTATLAWLFSNVYYRVASLEDFAKSTTPQAAQIAVIQEKVSNMQLSLQRLETFLTTPSSRPLNTPQNR